MEDTYIWRGGKKLRCGYTTGSCAAAAANAAVKMLLGGKVPETVELMTPKGILLTLEPVCPEFGEGYASCAIKKDSGDDPDITNGILVFVRAEKTASGTKICGGKGIGTVTKKGLDRPVGDAAINSVPRKMISLSAENAAEEYGYCGGLRLTVSVPDGEEIAKKTFNPRMGIIGGISIIGTSGIVEPMSSKALVDTIHTEEKMLRAEGRNGVLLTIGNYSESFLSEELPLMLEKSVKCSNFIGDAIDGALEQGFDKILIIGHIGKLVKLGAGIMNTHSSQADGRMDVLVTCGVLCGADTELLRQLPDCVTTDDALDILESGGYLQPVIDKLMERTKFYLDAKVKNEVPIGAVMFSNKFGLLGMTEGAQELIRQISEEYNG